MASMVSIWACVDGEMASMLARVDDLRGMSMGNHAIKQA